MCSCRLRPDFSVFYHQEERIRMTTILLVDDEKLVLRSLEKTLLRAGFDVLTAVDCRSGLDTFKAMLLLSILPFLT